MNVFLALFILFFGHIGLLSRSDTLLKLEHPGINPWASKNYKMQQTVKAIEKVHILNSIS